MNGQNFSNHKKYVKGFHGLLFVLLLLLLGGSVSYLFHAPEEQLYPATLMVLVVFTLHVMVWYIRIFPLELKIEPFVPRSDCVIICLPKRSILIPCECHKSLHSDLQVIRSFRLY